MDQKKKLITCPSVLTSKYLASQDNYARYLLHQRLIPKHQYDLPPGQTQEK